MVTTARAADADDVSLLVELMEAFYAESGHSLDRSWAATSFEAVLANASLGSVWLVFDGAAAAGYVVLTVCFSMEHGGLAAHIDDLFVRPAFRGRGAATVALAALFTDCRRRGVLAVNVEVGEDNVAASGLYRKLGLERRADRRILLSGRLPASTVT